jgi:hypothetical protein
MSKELRRRSKSTFLEVFVLNSRVVRCSQYTFFTGRREDGKDREGDWGLAYKCDDPRVKSNNE